MIRLEGEVHSSKNSRRILPTRSYRKPFVLAKSERAKEDESIFYWQLLDQLDKWQAMTRGMQYPLRVSFFFVRETNRRWDFANIAQGISDVMVKAGYLPDDDVRHFIPVFDGWRVDRDNPGCLFWITA